MARINAKHPIFVDSPATREIERLSKAALTDCLIDCCKRMYGEDVFADSPSACLNDACRTVLRMREDKNPWGHARGTESIGSRFDAEPHIKPRKG